MTDLAELEERVTEKWARTASQRVDLSGFNPNKWGDLRDWGAAADVPQFPREQWATYPGKRLIILMLVDRMLDLEMNDEQWYALNYLMLYGGRTRIA